MNPVVHFEMPFDDPQRMRSLHEQAFGWQTQALGEALGHHVVATTTQTSQGRPSAPGAINGGFFQREPDGPAQHPSVVIAVQGISRSMALVQQSGGVALGKPTEIPGVGLYVSFMDTEGNRVSMLQPLRRSGTP